MIQIYDVHNYVSIDGKEWCEIKTYLGNDWTIIYDEEDAVGGIVLDNVSFDRAYAYVINNYVDGLRPSLAIFSQKPQIGIRYIYEDEWKYIKSCKSFSLKREFELRPITLEWIVKHLEADQAIQYLKERGMGICPMTKTK